MRIMADAHRILQHFEHSHANLTAIRMVANEIGKGESPQRDGFRP